MYCLANLEVHLVGLAAAEREFFVYLFFVYLQKGSFLFFVYLYRALAHTRQKLCHYTISLATKK
jgi:hypothetical protein